MSSCNSKEKELNEDLERVRKERVKARQREEKERESFVCLSQPVSRTNLIDLEKVKLSTWFLNQFI